MSVLVVIGTYRHRIDTIVCFSEGWKSGFVPCKLNKVQACTPPSFPFFFWAAWASGNDALRVGITVLFPIRLLTDYWFHEKSARCPSSYSKAFRLLPKSGSSKVCFELLKTCRVTPESLAAEGLSSEVDKPVSYLWCTRFLHSLLYEILINEKRFWVVFTLL